MIACVSVWWWCWRAGGYYDHEPPPGTGTAPAPDTHRPCRDTDTAYNFDRLGPRLPVLLVSPWVEKGESERAQPFHTLRLQLAEARELSRELRTNA